MNCLHRIVEKYSEELKAFGVDIGSVDLSHVITLQLVFSPAPLGEECWLYFIGDYHQVTDMPLLLTRMFGHMMTAFYIFVRGEAPIFVLEDTCYLT